MAGSGPWVAAEWNPPVGARFERASTKYWDKKAGLIKTIVVTFSSDANTVLNTVQSGQADAAIQLGYSVLDAARNVTGKKVYEYATQGAYSIEFKDTRPGPVSNLKFRQAVAYALDRKTIGEQLLNNTCKPAFQPFPPGTLGSHSLPYKNPYPFNLNKAKQLLAESGVGANPQFGILLGAGTEPQTSITTAVVAQLKEAGITATVTSASTTTTTADFMAGKHDTQLQIMSGQVYPTAWYERFILPNGTLFKLASGPVGLQFETLVNSANDPTLKGPALQDKWDEITEQYLDNLWAIPICYDTRYWIMPKDVKNAGTLPWVSRAGAWDPRYLYRTGKA
jgi:peptide/nickel transport system substrate-binding protein